VNSGSSNQLPPDAPTHAAQHELLLIRTARREFARAGSLPKPELGTSSHRPADADAGAFQIPGYPDLERLHSGGQGLVFRARQQSTGQLVAIKVLHDAAAHEPREQYRLEREAQILAGLNHPNIVTVIDSGTIGCSRFLVMPYVDGWSLDSYVRHNHLSPREIAATLAKVADAVHSAHLRGVIHRDLKPGNVRVDRRGEPKILDFGLAKQSVDDVSSIDQTQTGQFVGSLPWASPEQVGAGAGRVDLRTDVYSLGVILYQLLTDKFPYPVFGALGDTIDNIQNSEPVSLRSVDLPGCIDGRSESRPARSIDDELETIVRKCLNKDPARRYQSGGDLARDLRHYLNGEAIEAKRDSRWYVFRKFVARNRGLALAAGSIAAVLFVAAVGMSLLAGWALRERGSAEEQRGLAERREKETDRVAEFQVGRLREIDPQRMGVRLRAALSAEIARSLEGSGLSADERSARGRDFDALLSGGNLTNVALLALRENIFDQTLAAIHDQFEAQPLLRARLLHTFGVTLLDLGLVQEAQAPVTEALSLYTHELGAEDRATLSSMSDLGTVLVSQGKLAEAEPVHSRALEARRRVLGDGDPETLTSVANMATLRAKQGKSASAEQLFREALDGRRRVLGADHKDTLGSICSLASLLQDRGRLTEAAPLFREALEGYRRVLGDEDSKTLHALDGLGSLLLAEGKPREAEPYIRDVLQTRRRLLGDDHPDTLHSIRNLADLMQARGKLDEAERLIREELESTRRVLGEDHPDTHAAVGNLGLLLYSQAKYAEAEPYARAALETQRRVLGDDHYNTMTSANNLGGILQALGRIPEAEPYWRETLERRREVLGPDHPDTMQSMNNMAVLLVSLKRNDEAVDLFREVLDARRRVLGEEHPDTLLTLMNLGKILRVTRGSAEAASALGAEEATVRRVFEGGDQSILGVYLSVLGRARADIGEFCAAEPILIEANGLLNQSAGVHPKLRAFVVTGLAELYHAWDVAEPGQGHDASEAEWRARQTQQPPNR
jgi:tetratricopeptide (TPR) repeat protein